MWDFLSLSNALTLKFNIFFFYCVIETFKNLLPEDTIFGFSEFTE